MELDTPGVTSPPRGSSEPLGTPPTTRTRPTKPQATTLAVIVGVIASVLVATADWYTLREAWLAEDAGPRFAVALLVLVLVVLRIGIAVAAGVLTRNVGLSIGIAATASTFFLWRQSIATLPGTIVADASEHSLAITPWSSMLIAAWTLALIGCCSTLLWPGIRWPRRLRNATPFLVGASVLLVVFPPFG